MAALGPLWTRPCSGTRPEGASEAKSAPPPKKSKKPHSFCFLRPNRGKVSIDSALKRHIRPAHLPSQSPRQTAPPGLARTRPTIRSLDLKMQEPYRPKIAIQRFKQRNRKSVIPKEQEIQEERAREKEGDRQKEERATERVTATEGETQSERGEKATEGETERATAKEKASESRAPKFQSLEFIVSGFFVLC